MKNHRPSPLPPLQGGPGCSSMLGAFYINGPERVGPGGRTLTPNAGGAWTRVAGVLYVDQPVGTGFSVPAAGPASIPRDAPTAAADLYTALAGLLGEGGALGVDGARPVIVTGESYAGKWVPALAAHALAVEAAAAAPRGAPLASPASRAFALTASGRAAASRVAAAPPPPHRPPLRLAAAAVGNGLVDPAHQVLTHADVLFYAGLIDADQWATVSRAALRASALAAAHAWAPAHATRAALLADLTSAAGLGTLLDVRRYDDYDARGDVPALLNRAAVRAALGVPADTPPFETCSSAVLAAMDEDVMQGVTSVYGDLLAAGLPLLLYEGAADAQDGPASAAAWQAGLRWPGRANYTAGKRELWTVGGRVAGYVRRGGGLTTVTLRNAGHMAPHDAPEAALAMVGEWVAGVVSK